MLHVNLQSIVFTTNINSNRMLSPKFVSHMSKPKPAINKQLDSLPTQMYVSGAKHRTYNIIDVTRKLLGNTLMHKYHRIII